MNKLAAYLCLPALLVTQVACEKGLCTSSPEQDCKISITEGPGDNFLDKFSGGQINFTIDNLPFNQNVSAELKQTNNMIKLPLVRFEPMDKFYSLSISSRDLAGFMLGALDLDVMEQGFVGHGQFFLKEKMTHFTLKGSYEAKNMPMLKSWGIAAAGIVALEKPTIIHLQYIDSMGPYVNFLAYDTDFKPVPLSGIGLPTTYFSYVPNAPSLVDIRESGVSILAARSDQTGTTIINCPTMGNKKTVTCSLLERGNSTYLANSTAISVTPDGQFFSIAPFNTENIEIVKMDANLPSVSSIKLLWSGVKIMKWIDLDGDAMPEILVISPSGNDVQIIKKDINEKYAVDENLTKTWKDILWPDETPPMPPITALGIGDVNGDSEPDLAIARGNDVSFVLISKDRLTKRIKSAITVPTQTGNFAITSLALSDLDADGKADLLIAKPGDVASSGWMYWYKNESSF